MPLPAAEAALLAVASAAVDPAVPAGLGAAGAAVAAGVVGAPAVAVEALAVLVTRGLGALPLVGTAWDPAAPRSTAGAVLGVAASPQPVLPCAQSSRSAMVLRFLRVFAMVPGVRSALGQRRTKIGARLAM
jgi:hypothetical protein